MTKETRAPAAAVCAPALVLALPFLVFASHNHYPWTSPALWLACAAVVLPGVVLGGMGQVTGLPGSVGALAIAVALAADLHLREWATATRAAAAALAVVFVLALALRLRERLFPVATVFLGFVVVTTPLVQRGRPLFAETTTPSDAPVRPDLPPIVHLVLDEQGAALAIPDEAKGSAEVRRALGESYVANGFTVYSHAYSRYYDSYNSIPNLLNLTSPPLERAHLSADRGEDRILLDAAYFARLRERGYHIRVYQSSFMDFSRSPGVPVDYALTYEIHDLGVLAALDAPVTQRASLLLASFLRPAHSGHVLRALYDAARGASGQKLPPWPHSPRAVSVPAAATLRRITADLAHGDHHGTLVFAHITLPHYTYMLDAHCRPWPSTTQWVDRAGAPGAPIENQPAERITRYEKYLQQTLCAQSLVGELVAAMRANGEWDDAIVVIHGDHGSRISHRTPVASNFGKLGAEDQRDCYAAFFAIKTPALPPGVREAPLALQDALTLVLDAREPAPSPLYVYERRPGDELREVPFTGFDAR